MAVRPLASREWSPVHPPAQEAVSQQEAEAKAPYSETLSVSLSLSVPPVKSKHT